MNVLRFLQRLLCIALFGLIILGAAVRLSNAGLACPDWPLCLGKAIPSFNFQIFMEWVHRLIAGLSGILSLLILLFIVTNREYRVALWRWPIAIIVLFGVQAVLGWQTVSQRLQSDIVAAHLVGGYLLLGANFFLLRKMQNITSSEAESKTLYPALTRSAANVLPLLVLSQSVLGARVSSRYAGLACEDFPTCHGLWWPNFVGQVGYQMIHRFGAYSLIILSIILVTLLLKRTTDRSLRGIWLSALILIFLQAGLGASMVLLKLPPSLSLLHSALALSIFSLFVVGSARVNRH